MPKDTVRYPKQNSFSFSSLALRGLAHHWRSNALLACGCAVGAIILIGALLIGDSLRNSLHILSESRLGKTQWVVLSSQTTFSAFLADSIKASFGTTTAPVLLQTGSISIAGNNRRLPGVTVAGTDERFWDLSPRRQPPLGIGDSNAVVNRALADKLGIRTGDDIILRFDKSGVL